VELKRTINNEPSKFFTYNNGIAKTAAQVEIEEVMVSYLLQE
jgi:hypothetical protein